MRWVEHVARIGGKEVTYTGFFGEIWGKEATWRTQA